MACFHNPAEQKSAVVEQFMVLNWAIFEVLWNEWWGLKLGLIGFELALFFGDGNWGFSPLFFAVNELTSFST
jgi:hypothetical protein